MIHKHWNLFCHYIFANRNSTTVDIYCDILLAIYNETYTKKQEATIVIIHYKTLEIKNSTSWKLLTLSVF